MAHFQRSNRADILGAFAVAALAPELAARGLGQVNVFTLWPDIVGADIAQYMRPAKFQWPVRGPKSPPRESAAAVLVVHVDSARALDAQFAIPRVIDAVNAHLGWRCIGSIVVKQQRFDAPAAPKRTRTIDKAAEKLVQDSVEAVNDDALRQALFRLGVMVKVKTSGAGVA